MGHSATDLRQTTNRSIMSPIAGASPTDYTCDPITGNVTQIRFPLTHGRHSRSRAIRDRRSITPTRTTTYLHTIQDEAAILPRSRMTQATIASPASIIPTADTRHFPTTRRHFYQISTHRMKTGGTETFAYDAQHRLQYYSDPYHSNPDNPSINTFTTDWIGISGIADALDHSTNFDYNDRGQITVTTLPWINGVRYTISNLYNADGTDLQSKTDELRAHHQLYL